MYRRKFRGKRKPKTVKAKLNKLSKAVSKLKVQREVKEFVTFDTTLTYLNPDFNGAVGQFGTAIQAGTGHQERVGREIVPVSLKGRFVINGPNGTTSSIWIPYRIIIFQDKQGVSTPTGQEILTGVPATGGVYDAIYATYNTDYVCHKGDQNNRYKILFDKIGFVSSRASNYKPTVMVKMAIPGKRLDVVNYADQTSGGARAGKIWYLIYTGIDATATNNSSVWKYAELDFTDS